MLKNIRSNGLESPVTAPLAQLECLEARRHLSVSATTFFGPPDIGTKWVYDATAPTGTKSRHQITLAGTAKVGGVKTLRLETSQKFGDTTVTGSAFNTVDDLKGVVQHKAQATTASSKSKTLVTTVFKPPAVSCPPKLVAGKMYKFTWTSTTETVTGKMTHTAKATRTYSIKLLSDTPAKIKVPAGTFAAYPIQTTLAGRGGGFDFNTSSRLWVAPGVGMVKTVTTNNGQTATGALAAFTRGGGTPRSAAPPVQRVSRLFHGAKPSPDLASLIA